MDNIDVLPASRISLYWQVWLSIVAVALVWRFAFFFPDEKHPGMWVTYALCTWPPIVMLNLREGGRLMSYLQAHYHQEWQELTYTHDGARRRDLFQMLSWLRSKDERGDNILIRLKQDYRRFIWLSFAVLISEFAMGLILIL